MAATTPRFSRLPAEDRRGQIFAQARRLFSERPPAEVSMQDIADAAGVRRGLVNHYFGTKRDLYLAVVREMVRLPPPPLARTWPEALDAWLEMVERHRETWVAALTSRDPELAPILEQAREAGAARVLEIAGVRDTPGARARVRAYGGAAEAATLEWLVRGRLTRAEVHDLLVTALKSLVVKETP